MGLNIKRYGIAVIAMFGFIYLYETLVHGFSLLPLYAATPHLWRSLPDMQARVPYNLGIMLLLSLWITFLFTRFYPQGGWRNGLHFGWLIGMLSGIQAAGAYYYLPVSLALAASWFGTNLIESLLAGMIIGAVYALSERRS